MFYQDNLSYIHIAFGKGGGNHKVATGLTKVSAQLQWYSAEQCCLLKLKLKFHIHPFINQTSCPL